jgi:hypothetical protein
LHVRAPDQFAFLAVTTDTLLGVSTPVTVAAAAPPGSPPPPPPHAVTSPNAIKAKATPHTFKKDLAI